MMMLGLLIFCVNLLSTISLIICQGSGISVVSGFNDLSTRFHLV